MRRTLAAVLSMLAIAMLALTPGSAAGPQFGPWVRVGSGATEPGIHIGPDGSIFVDGPGGTPGHSLLWRSNDSGATFAPVQFGTGINRLPGGGDSDLAIRGSKLYFIDLWVGSNSLSISENNGATWTSGTPFTSLPASDRQWIALGRPDDITGMDTVYVLYALIQEPRQVMIARSRTGGLTWEGHFVAPALTGARGFTGQLLSDGDRFLAFTWEDQGVIKAAYSENEGETWGSSTIAENVLGVIPGTALDGDRMVATWIDRLSYSVKAAVSENRGKDWSAPVTLSAPDTTNLFSWIDARDGKIAVAWYGADGDLGDPNDVPVSTVWTTRYAESFDGATFGATAEVGPGKTGPICTLGLSCGLGGENRELGDFLSVAIDAQGNANVVFGGRLGNGVKFAKQIA